MKPVLQQFADARGGLAFEAELFAADGAVAGLWTSAERALVCPAAYRRRDGFDTAVAQSQAQGWPVMCRPTGGGAVPQGPGVLNLALAFEAPQGFTISDGYRLITRVIRMGLGPAGTRLATGPTPDSYCDGDWNLSIGGKKIVGTAQRWRPLAPGHTRVLAHALIVVTGSVVPGAKAVDAFNRSLGLGAIAPEVHTTLTQADAGFATDIRDLAQGLSTAATQELQSIPRRLAG